MGDDDNNRQFPWKLHSVLAAAESNGYTHIISWLPAGNAFMVNDKVEFANKIMPKHFNSKKFKTFQRNLNLWGFRTLTKNPNKGAIFHPDFIRSNPDQCNLMKRIRIRKKSPRMTLEEFQACVNPKPTSPSRRQALPSPFSSAPTALPSDPVAQLPTPISINKQLQHSGPTTVMGSNIPMVMNVKPLSATEIHPNYSMANNNNYANASLPPSWNGSLMATRAAFASTMDPQQNQLLALPQLMPVIDNNNIASIATGAALDLIQRQLGVFPRETNKNSSTTTAQGEINASGS